MFTTTKAALKVLLAALSQQRSLHKQIKINRLQTDLTKNNKIMFMAKVAFIYMLMLSEHIY